MILIILSHKGRKGAEKGKQCDQRTEPFPNYSTQTKMFRDFNGERKRRKNKVEEYDGFVYRNNAGEEKTHPPFLPYGLSGTFQ